jgi:uncharacterized Zn finger protein
MITMKKTLSADIDEIKSIRLVCTNCGEQTSVNVYSSQHIKSIENVCPGCGKEFHNFTVGYAAKLGNMLFNFKKLKADHANGADIVFEIDLDS